MVPEPGEGSEPRPRKLTKEIQLSREEAKLLSRLADERGMTEPEVLRDGLRLQARMAQRARNIGALVELIEGPEPKKIGFEPK